MEVRDGSIVGAAATLFRFYGLSSELCVVVWHPTTKEFDYSTPETREAEVLEEQYRREQEAYKDKMARKKRRERRRND